LARGRGESTVIYNVAPEVDSGILPDPVISKDHRLVAVGSDGMIVFDDVVQGEKKLLLFSHVLSTNNGTPEIHRAEAVPVAFSKTEPLLLECNHFLKCSKSGKRPISDWHEATQVLKVLKACESSILSGASATA
jgi:UDP-2-acetamido-3-amino-2,3-dideoxy-glucuronate N-acetyltransferase